MENKLLPCPFCGGEAEVANVLYMDDSFIFCNVCGVITKVYGTAEEAINVWNTRTNTIPVGNGKDYTVVNDGR